MYIRTCSLLTVLNSEQAEVSRPSTTAHGKDLPVNSFVDCSVHMTATIATCLDVAENSRHVSKTQNEEPPAK